MKGSHVSVHPDCSDLINPLESVGMGDGGHPRSLPYGKIT